MTQPVLVVVDHQGGRPTQPSTEVLTAARGLADEVIAVWLGPPPQTDALDVLGRYGTASVYVPALDGLAPEVTPVAVEAVRAVISAVSPQAVLMVSSFAGKELAGGLAVALGSGAIVDATGVQRDGDGVISASKTAFAATWDTRCTVTSGLPVIAVQATAVEATPVATPVGVVQHEIAVDFSARARAVRLVERTEHPRTGEVPLAEAQTVVVGGRGTGGDFTAVEELAELLGGAVGATRDVTDEGWREHSAQVGQTGVTVAPRLYIGLGVSGAVHHTVGMQAAQTIVAVNNDSEAPLFEIADFGVVGDLEDVVPQAIEALREHRES